MAVLSLTILAQESCEARSERFGHAGGVGATLTSGVKQYRTCCQWLKVSVAKAWCVFGRWDILTAILCHGDYGALAS
jgi:hypothetical protein